jgi:uncharacterized repeat protein (TIGR03803 family)
MKRKKSLAILGGSFLIVIAILLSVSNVWAVEYKVLHRFSAKHQDGEVPDGTVIVDAAGNLYGTTANGGSHGLGTIFKVTPNPDGSWTESIIYNFTGPDGTHPAAGLIMDHEGSFYGTAHNGGAYDGGTVYKLNHNPDDTWTQTVLLSFSGPYHGSLPYAGVIFGPDGSLYGTTSFGGNYNGGSVFSLTPQPDGSWSCSVLHYFGGNQDGWGSDAGVVFDNAGNLYGTTAYGGPGGEGIVFKLTPQPEERWRESRIHNFKGRDGVTPYGGLIFDRAGNLYGTTAYGGAHDQGTVFKLTPHPDGSWTRSKVHVFNGKDGAQPWIDLTIDAAGNLYGTTVQGGEHNSGTVFKLTQQPDSHWKLTRLHVFKEPHSLFTGVTLDAAGNLYGATNRGGKGSGIVYRITP